MTFVICIESSVLINETPTSLWKDVVHHECASSTAPTWPSAKEVPGMLITSQWRKRSSTSTRRIVYNLCVVKLGKQEKISRQTTCQFGQGSWIWWGDRPLSVDMIILSVVFTFENSWRRERLILEEKVCQHRQHLIIRSRSSSLSTSTNGREHGVVTWSVEPC